jgi:hypothetical protein
MLVDFTGDGDAGLAEDVGDLRLAQARGVVFECELIFLLIDAEAAETVGVGELAEAVELFEAERGLQFVGDFEECHGGIIPAPNKANAWLSNGRLRRRSLQRPSGT